MRTAFRAAVRAEGFWIAMLMALLLTGCATVLPPPSSTPSANPPPFATTLILGRDQPSLLPAVAEEQARRNAALTAAPYILLREDLTPRLAAAQDLVVDDARLHAYTRSSDGGRLLTEVMSVAPARPGDLAPTLLAQCPPQSCLRLILYVYATNTTVSVTLDQHMQLIDLQALASAQPEIPERLANLATQIAINAPEVSAALEGLSPTEAMALMSATKTTLEASSCERSRHLCVAPVFTWGERAIWTVIDLTELRLVAAQTWTEQGQSARRRAVSEATLQDAALAPLCEQPGRVERDGWRFDYLLTSSDGLELRMISYQGRPLLNSIKLVDWHVGYEGSGAERVGFSDAVGCPVFSAAAVIPYGPPRMSDGPGAPFTLTISFRSPAWPQPCNYQYSFTAHFAADGSLKIAAANEGRGCGINGTYHPVWRIEPAAPATLSYWDSEAATVLPTEGQAEWRPGDDHAFQLTDSASTLQITPDWGDAELAYVYWSRARPGEGQGDLASIGSCCALDARQGPEQFIGSDLLEQQPILWYVPRLTNGERVRCWADMRLEDGLLRPVIWPCSAGLLISHGDSDARP